MVAYQPGKLVAFRGREWVVLPSGDADLIMLKPIGGSDEEVTAVFAPLDLPDQQLAEATFPEPGGKDLHSFDSAKLLFDATRLSFRNASGPFRAMGKLSFRPRSYQLVPLVMALRQERTRLLIADDVGIGKTVEALLILKELLERAEVSRFAVICPPHLCEQWQAELADKLDIEADIIRSSTAAALDRKLPDDRSVFHHLPYQVISMDYIKADRRRDLFLADAPEFIIVDEAHTCALPSGATSPTQQQRYYLLHDLIKRNNPHLLLLTATPHSGKDDEFQSLLGLLNPVFKKLDIGAMDQNQRRQVAKYFVQRKRENIRRWLGEDTPFPDRKTLEQSYRLSPAYLDFYNEVLQFARGLTQAGDNKPASRMRYWAALALLRGVMSSPAMALEMLRNRRANLSGDDAAALLSDEDKQLLADQAPAIVIEQTEQLSDASQTELIENADFSSAEASWLADLCQQAEGLAGIRYDYKAEAARKLTEKWVADGYNPIIFCRYIQTAQYLGKLLKSALPSGIDVQVVTSELADEQRRERVDAMGSSPKRVLVATDCLSEGINLQNLFTAVIHYDLPWNPNRLEQREGRVDRYGQMAPVIRTCLLYGEDSPIDRKVLDVLIRKVREIQKVTGVSIVLGEENTSLMEALVKDVLFGNSPGGQQLSLFNEQAITNELENARKKAENLRSIFAQETIKQDELEKDLKEVDEAIGDVRSVETFVMQAVRHLGGSLEPDKKGYRLDALNLPPHIRSFFPGQTRISFESPTPTGYRYIGRNHRFVEQLCQFLLGLAFEPKPPYQQVARASVIRTDAVTVKTTLVQFRVRNVIKEANSSRQVISEEMYFWGYSGTGPTRRTLSYADAKKLLLEAVSAAQLPLPFQEQTFHNEMQLFAVEQSEFHRLAEQRALHLVEAHGRFKDLVGGRRYEAVYPVLPPDVMGVYILLPVPPKL